MAHFDKKLIGEIRRFNTVLKKNGFELFEIKVKNKTKSFIRGALIDGHIRFTDINN